MNDDINITFIDNRFHVYEPNMNKFFSFMEMYYFFTFEALFNKKNMKINRITIYNNN